MKTLVYAQAVISLVILVTLSCNKTTDAHRPEREDVLRASTQETGIIKNWLLTQQQQTANGLVDSSLYNANWEMAEKVRYKDSIDFIVVPLNTIVSADFSNPRLITPKANARHFAFFSINNQKKVLQGNIAQFIPKNELPGIPASKLLAKVFRKEPGLADGAMTVFSINRQFLFQFQYENYIRVNELVVQTKNGFGNLAADRIGLNKANNQADASNAFSASSFPITAGSNMLTAVGDGNRKKENGMVCINWYLVTTYADGSQDWVFLYQTCSDNCEQTSITPKGEFNVITTGCRRGGGSGNGNCAYTESEAAQIISSITADNLSDAPSQSFSEAVTNPSTGEVTKIGATSPWPFLIIRVSPLWISLYSATYSAFYSSVVYKTADDPQEKWKWKSINYSNQTAITAGGFPPCISLSLVVADGGTTISPDGLTAHSLLYYTWAPTITCTITTVIGTATTSYGVTTWGSPKPIY